MWFVISRRVLGTRGLAAFVCFSCLFAFVEVAVAGFLIR